MEQLDYNLLFRWFVGLIDRGKGDALVDGIWFFWSVEAHFHWEGEHRGSGWVVTSTGDLEGFWISEEKRPAETLSPSGGDDPEASSKRSSTSRMATVEADLGTLIPRAL
jgi:hypothetical protein